MEKRNTKKSRIAARIADRASVGVATLVVKIVVLGVIDALSLYSAFLLISTHRWIILGFLGLGTAIVNWVYWSRKHIAAKYLVPGLAFLFIFQMFAIVYSAYIAVTNYGTGHNVTKEHAITSLLQSSVVKTENSAVYSVSVIECGSTLGLLAQDPTGQFLQGDATTPLHVVAVSPSENGRPDVAGCRVLNFDELLTQQDQVTNLTVPVSENPNDGVLRTSDGQTAYVFQSQLTYDEKSDTITDTRDGKVYRDTGVGMFTADDGAKLTPGWRVNVGFANFVRAFTMQEIRGPFFSVLVWTIEFSVISVASSFFLGLFLAIVFNNPRMRGRRVYRSILILPYAFPGFLSALVWAGLLNQKFGFINQVLLGGADIAWLQSPTLAKIAVLTVNLWLGFPYMFLVCMGALQSIPEEITEAAKLDGASAWQIFRLIKFPLLLVSVAPLLISSFAMTFNNFNLIYMLTGGGPVNTDGTMNIGSTDILISMVYKIAFVGADRDYGLASAFAIMIFFIVAAVSAIGFKMSKSLEELN